MDNLIYRYGTDEIWADRCLGWQKEFCFVPRRCYYSNKFLWLTTAYKGTAVWTGPGEPVFDHRWCDTKEFLFQKIKGKI